MRYDNMYMVLTVLFKLTILCITSYQKCFCQVQDCFQTSAYISGITMNSSRYYIQTNKQRRQEFYLSNSRLFRKQNFLVKNIDIYCQCKICLTYSLRKLVVSFFWFECLLKRFSIKILLLMIVFYVSEEEVEDELLGEEEEDDA